MSEIKSAIGRIRKGDRYKAIFIGGEYDLTKMMLETNPKFYYLCELPKMEMLPRDFNVAKEPYTMEAGILTYMLIGETPEGILIYEYRRNGR